MSGMFAVIKRHFSVLIAAGGVVLIAMGVLIWTGELFQLNIQAQRALEGLGVDFFNSV
jgi:cytochrome c-type biogenesis protein